MGSKTPLYDKHVEAGARIVDFGGLDVFVVQGCFQTHSNSFEQ